MPAKLPSILIAASFYVVAGLILQFLVQPSGDAATGFITATANCVLILAAATLAVWHYTSTYELTIPAGAGAGMGAAALVLGVAIGLAVAYALIGAGVLPDPQVAAEQQMRAQGMSREEIEMAKQFSSPVIGSAIALLFGAVGGAAGGALGAVLFKRGPADDLA